MKRNKQHRYNTKTSHFAGILVLPFIFGLIAALFWVWVLYGHGINFSEEAGTPFLYMIMPLVGFVYVIFASLAVTASLERYKQLTRSVVRKDIGAYLEHRDQPLPFLLRGLVAIPSLVLMFLALMYKYADLSSGVVSVFIVTVLVSLTWLVIVELDAVHRRKYFKKNTPEHWHETTAHEFFTEDK